jgi:hypothetical protein
MLANVWHATQLCSVRGCSKRPPSMHTTVVARTPGFLLSLEFFHAYDRISIQWVDHVLKAMTLGVILLQWASTLHRQASACFSWHTLSPDMAVVF